MSSYWVGRTAAAAMASVTTGSFLYWMTDDNSADDRANNNNVRVGTDEEMTRFPFYIPTPGRLLSFSNQNKTLCEAEEAKEAVEGVDPSFPNLSRFGQHSYLKRFLTPEVYASLKDKKTSGGVTLEDMIQTGVCLPYGARPPRGCGIYAGDADSYRVFSLILSPILEDYHHYRLAPRKRKVPPGRRPPPSGGSGGPGRGSMLRRQVTNLNPRYVLQQNLDPDGQYILSTRMRVARSIQGFAFSPAISRLKRRELEALFTECAEDWKDDKDIGGVYLRVMDMTNEHHDDLIERHILFHDPDEYSISAGLGRDWPDSRGIYLDDQKDPEFTIWINAEDHLRIITMSKGGDLLKVFTRLSKALHAIESSLKKRGRTFCIDSRLGFLNTSPENCGTALRASVFVKLPRLGQQPGFEALLERLRLDTSSRFKGKRYAGIFDIANSERLGQSEVQLLNTMINGVGRLIALEKQLEQGEKLNLDEIEASQT
jgi:creatine kinase